MSLGWSRILMVLRARPDPLHDRIFYGTVVEKRLDSGQHVSHLGIVVDLRAGTGQKTGDERHLRGGMRRASRLRFKDLLRTPAAAGQHRLDPARVRPDGRRTAL